MDSANADKTVGSQPKSPTNGKFYTFAKMVASISVISSTKEMNPITRKSMSKLEILLALWNSRHLKKPENTRQVWQSVHPSHTFVSYFRVFQMSVIRCVWPPFLKLSCITDFDTFFLVLGFVSVVD